MKLSKYQHACFTVEKDGKLLVVDPGNMTQDLGAPENVTAIVITHEHADHFDVAALGALIAHNPDAVIYAHSDITRQIGDALPNKAVNVGDLIEAAPFTLEFLGGDHAVIHKDMPQVANLGMMINGTIYYPGDSFYVPERAVDTLALPVGAPWLKIGEVIDYVRAIKPRLAFPTHDAVLSQAGQAMADRMVPQMTQETGVDYKRLNGHTIEIDEVTS